MLLKAKTFLLIKKKERFVNYVIKNKKKLNLKKLEILILKYYVIV